jgi:hypothetical protein
MQPGDMRLTEGLWFRGRDHFAVKDGLIVQVLSFEVEQNR